MAADAYLACAERLLADGKKLEALAIYKALSKSQIKHVQLAAMRGLLAVAGKSSKPVCRRCVILWLSPSASVPLALPVLRRGKHWQSQWHPTCQT